MRLDDSIKHLSGYDERRQQADGVLSKTDRVVDDIDAVLSETMPDFIRIPLSSSLKR